MSALFILAVVMPAWAAAAIAWLETNVGAWAPWALLTVAIWLAVYLVRKFAPNAWEWFASLGPGGELASKTFQGLPATLAGALVGAVTTGDYRGAFVGALAGALAPLKHHALKALPIAYLGGSYPAASRAPQPEKKP